VIDSGSLDANEFGPPHRVVELGAWHDTLAELRADGYTYFDWLSAVDEEADGFRLVAHVLRPDPWDHLLVATFLDAESPTVTSVADVYAGASWHERETHEMFGIDFGIPLEPLLLPDGFEGHPLRKQFVLASRVVKAWPGAKEPGESDSDMKRGDVQSRTGGRRMKPPGVPDDWVQDPAGVPDSGQPEEQGDE
jgi:NADH-quinone oxidoreductase subunit C